MCVRSSPNLRDLHTLLPARTSLHFHIKSILKSICIASATLHMHVHGFMYRHMILDCTELKVWCRGTYNYITLGSHMRLAIICVGVGDSHAMCTCPCSLHLHGLVHVHVQAHSVQCAYVPELDINRGTNLCM